MARPLPVNLFMAGTGAVLIVSGISGESLGEVLKGNFGKNPAQKQAADQGEGTMQSVADTEGAASPTSFSSATFAPSPMTLTRPKNRPSKQQQAVGIAAVFQRLYGPGAKVTQARLNHARAVYERETGIQQFERAGENAQEFLGGLPLV